MLQRALLVCWSVCIPVAVLWLNSGRLLVALGQERDISMLAGRYLAMCIPCLFLGVAMECIKKYLQVGKLMHSIDEACEVIMAADCHCSGNCI